MKILSSSGSFIKSIDGEIPGISQMSIKFDKLDRFRRKTTGSVYFLNKKKGKTRVLNTLINSRLENKIYFFREPTIIFDKKNGNEVLINDNILKFKVDMSKTELKLMNMSLIYKIYDNKFNIIRDIEISNEFLVNNIEIVTKGLKKNIKYIIRFGYYFNNPSVIGNELPKRKKLFNDVKYELNNDHYFYDHMKPEIIYLHKRYKEVLDRHSLEIEELLVSNNKTIELGYDFLNIINLKNKGIDINFNIKSKKLIVDSDGVFRVRYVPLLPYKNNEYEVFDIIQKHNKIKLKYPAKAIRFINLNGIHLNSSDYNINNYHLEFKGDILDGDKISVLYEIDFSRHFIIDGKLLFEVRSQNLPGVSVIRVFDEKKLFIEEINYDENFNLNNIENKFIQIVYKFMIMNIEDEITSDFIFI